MKALWDTQTQSVAPYPRADEAPVYGLDPRYVVVTIVQQEVPAFDSLRQVVSPTESYDGQSTVTRGWTVRAMTYEEAALARPSMDRNMATPAPTFTLTELSLTPI